MRTLVSGGLVVGPERCTEADVVVDDQTIVRIERRPNDLLAGGGFERVVQAVGHLVVPGGVDVHTHLEAPSHGTISSDSFESGTLAALHGGTTTIVDFAVQQPSIPLAESALAWVSQREGRSYVDFSCHLIVTNADDRCLDELEALVDSGVTSVKAFMAYPHLQLPDESLFALMRRAGECGCLPMLHAENGPVADRLASEAVSRGCLDPRFYAGTRPPALEGEAVARAAKLAKVAESGVFIAHISSADGVRSVQRGREDEADIHGETCPHYLYLGEEEAQDTEAVLRRMCCPPIRQREHQAHLWAALQDRTIEVVSTDHSPFMLAQRAEAAADGFEHIPMGIPGIEHRLDLMFEATRAGWLSLTDWVRLTASGPADMFGLASKGEIAVGKDADVVIYDQNSPHSLGLATHHMNVDYSVYEGFKVTGRVRTVIRAGVVVIEDGVLASQSTAGRFIRRRSYQPQ